MNRIKHGFTLAEVLITLGIIGVVAAMTIPTLMNNIQDNEFHTAIKKIYSNFSNATEKMSYDNSGAIWDNSSADYATLSKNMAEAYGNYFSFIKEDLTENLRTTDIYNYKSSTLATATNSGGLKYGAILKDGTYVRFYSNQSCSQQVGNILNYCGNMIVDVNGTKPPNMAGRDAYALIVQKDSNGNYKIVPCGPDTDQGTCDIGSGYGCTEYVINNQPLPQ